MIPRYIFYALGNQELVSELNFLRFVAEVLLIAMVRGVFNVQPFSLLTLLVVTDDWTDD